MRRFTENYFSLKIIFIITLLVLIINGCANRIPPDGGPIDTTAPEIISTYPKDKTLNFKDNYLRFEFDRYIDELSFQEAIFISPSVGELEFDWSGTEVVVTFSKKLKPNTTYVVNIGSDVKDRYINQKNMEKSFSIAFSTGNEIDRGKIEGMVFPLKEGGNVAGIMIFAYRTDEIKTDTLNPTTSQPDFITQTGKSGDFYLHHIPFGEYRIFAIKDEYRNLFYDQEVDEYGVQSKPIRLTDSDTLVNDIFIKLAKEDTTSPRLLKLSSLDRNHVIAEFSELIDPTTINESSFVIRDTVSQDELPVVVTYPSTTVKNAYVVVTQNQDSGKSYRGVVNAVRDSAGNAINLLSNSFVFSGSSKIDTAGPKLISISINDSAKNVSLQPVIILTFSDAMKGSFDWIDILNPKKEIIPAKKKWINKAQFLIEPKAELVSKTWYSISAQLYNLTDWAERKCRDSIKVWHFETLDLEDLSSIEGIVLDSNQFDLIGKIYVIATNIDEKEKRQYIVVADESGKFFFPQVAEGNYVLQAFRDRNGDGKYDFGKPFPFSYSERMSNITSAYKVRARWPLEGIVIKMK